jgi:hypothetical protein
MVSIIRVSMGPADFTGTILYCGRRLHSEHGWIEVLGCQNTAVNLATGPNAMLLHLPAHSVLVLWYRPLDQGRLILSAIDCHTGADWGERVGYGAKPKRKLLEFLPQRVMGAHSKEILPNGDFAVAHDDLLRGDLHRVERVRPM